MGKYCFFLILIITLFSSACEESELRQSRPSDDNEGVDGYLAEETQDVDAGQSASITINNTEVIVEEGDTNTDAVVRLRTYSSPPEDNVAIELGEALGDIVNISFLDTSSQSKLGSSILDGDITIVQRLSGVVDKGDLKMVVVTDPGLTTEKTQIIESRRLTIDDDFELNLLSGTIVEVDASITSATIWVVESNEAVPTRITTINPTDLKSVVDGEADTNGEGTQTPTYSKTIFHLPVIGQGGVYLFSNSTGTFESRYLEAQTATGMFSGASFAHQDGQSYILMKNSVGVDSKIADLYSTKTNDTTFVKVKSAIDIFVDEGIEDSAVTMNGVNGHAAFEPQANKISEIVVDSSNNQVTERVSFEDQLDPFLLKNAIIDSDNTIHYIYSTSTALKHVEVGTGAPKKSIVDENCIGGTIKAKIDSSGVLRLCYYCSSDNGSFWIASKGANGWGTAQKITELAQPFFGIDFDFIVMDDGRVAISYRIAKAIHLYIEEKSGAVKKDNLYEEEQYTTVFTPRFGISHEGVVNLFFVGKISDTESEMIWMAGNTFDTMTTVGSPMALPNGSIYNFTPEIGVEYK